MDSDLAKHLTPYARVMYDTLTRQAGRDALEVATEWYPEFADTPAEWKAKVFQSVHDIMRVKGEPFTPENAKHAAQFFLSNLECDMAAAEEANPSNPPAFVPKSAEVENDFFQTATADQLKDYFLAKHGAR